MCAASLFRLAPLVGEEQPWRNLALKLMEYVRAELWNRVDAGKRRRSWPRAFPTFNA